MPPPVEGGSSALGIGTIGGIIGGTLGFIICIFLPLALWFYRRNMLEKARISPTFAQELVDRASVDNGNAGKLARRTLGTKGLEEVEHLAKRVPEMSTDYTDEITRIKDGMSEGAWNSASAKDSRFSTEAFMLVFGLAADTALGLPHYMKVSGHVIRTGMNEGVKAIQREIEEHGTDEDKECLHYVLHEKAGGSVTRFANGVRDEGRNEETFEDFCNHATCTACNLEPSHVLALRLYSTAVYKSINAPLRDTKRSGPHPLAITVSFVDEGVRRLRAVGAQASGAVAQEDLWRGMRNAEIPDEFLQLGGTELAPMSTTTSLQVAMEYCASKSALILRLNTSSFMERGADIGFLSAFPNEKEVLYPPLTFLRATGAKQTVTVGDGSVTILEVIPSM